MATVNFQWDINPSNTERAALHVTGSLQHCEPGGFTTEFLVGVCRPVPQILTQFQTKIFHFPHPFSDVDSKIHTRFQTFVGS